MPEWLGFVVILLAFLANVVLMFKGYIPNAFASGALFLALAYMVIR